jgi:hypothetical protein
MWGAAMKLADGRDGFVFSTGHGWRKRPRIVRIKIGEKKNARQVKKTNGPSFSCAE